jgi:serine/threonine-protein kinase
VATPLAYIQHHLNESLPSLHKYSPELPPALDDVIRQATARNISDRFNDVPALLAALQRALSADNGAINKEAPSQLSTQALAALENPYRGLRPLAKPMLAYFTAVLPSFKNC